MQTSIKTLKTKQKVLKEDLKKYMDKLEVEKSKMKEKDNMGIPPYMKEISGYYLKGKILKITFKSKSSAMEGLKDIEDMIKLVKEMEKLDNDKRLEKSKL